MLQHTAKNNSEKAWLVLRKCRIFQVSLSEERNMLGFVTLIAFQRWQYGKAPYIEKFSARWGYARCIWNPYILVYSLSILSFYQMCGFWWVVGGYRGWGVKGLWYHLGSAYVPYLTVKYKYISNYMRSGACNKPSGFLSWGVICPLCGGLFSLRKSCLWGSQVWRALRRKGSLILLWLWVRDT